MTHPVLLFGGLLFERNFVYALECLPAWNREKAGDSMDFDSQATVSSPQLRHLIHFDASVFHKRSQGLLFSE